MRRKLSTANQRRLSTSLFLASAPIALSLVSTRITLPSMRKHISLGKHLTQQLRTYEGSDLVEGNGSDRSGRVRPYPW